MKVYVAGRVTNGETLDEIAVTDNLDVGARVSIKLQFAGHRVYSPFLLSPQWIEAGYTWDECLAHCFAMILECDAALFLPGWSESKGAKKEHELCKLLGVKRLYDINELL